MAELSKSEISSLFSAAHAAADVAKSITLSYFRSDRLNTENKAADGYDPVTRADREAEAAIRDVLGQLRPQDAVMGEEMGTTGGTSGLTWVLDPIDGTRGYVSGTPTWGTLISVRDSAGPILGLIDQPYIGERFVGGPGVAELQNGAGVQPLGVRPAAELSESILFTTFPEVGSAHEGNGFQQLSAKTRLTRYGMDCYAYALLAAGQIDLVVEAGLHAYDIQAPIAVISAAGGIVTDWQGDPVHEGGRVLAAASEALHRAALEVLNKAPDN
jgi:myo-inositol-1(or 4)-monophosphatase